MNTISLPFPNVQFQNVNYFLTPLCVWDILERKMGTFCPFPNERKIAPPFYELFYPFLSPRLIVNQFSNYKHVSVQKVPSSPRSKKYRYFIFLFHYPKISNYMQLWGRGGAGGGRHFLSFFSTKLLNDYF